MRGLFSESLKIARLVRILGYAWIWLLALIVGIDLILILIEHGVGKLGSILSPHNLGEFLIIILALLPGWSLIWLARRIELRHEKVAKLEGARTSPNDVSEAK